MKFSKELKIKANDYLIKATGNQPEDETLIEFLSGIANLGELFLKNALKIENDIENDRRL